MKILVSEKRCMAPSDIQPQIRYVYLTGATHARFQQKTWFQRTKGHCALCLE